MVKCEICGKEFKSLKGISTHISQIHHVKTKDYFDKYLKTMTDGVCLNHTKYEGCLKTTKFINMVVGYHKYCSVKCMSNSEEHKKRSSECKLGDKHWLKRPGITHPNKDKTYVQLHGIKKANKLKNHLSELGKLLIGSKNPFFRKTHTEEIKEKFRQYRIGKTYIELYGEERSKEINRKREETCMNTIGVSNPFKTKEYREAQQKRMLNGRAAYLLSCVKNPSKPQVELFKVVNEVCPYPIMNYPCLNKSIDIAIPKLSIAIEYDGSYFHQDQEADDIRQKLLEEEGWKFLRYRDYVPTKNKLQKDIFKLLE